MMMMMMLLLMMMMISSGAHMCGPDRAEPDLTRTDWAGSDRMGSDAMGVAPLPTYGHVLDTAPAAMNKAVAAVKIASHNSSAHSSFFALSRSALSWKSGGEFCQTQSVWWSTALDGPTVREESGYVPLTTYHLLLTTYYVPLTTYHLLHTTYYLPLTTHYLPFTTYHSLLALTAYCLPLSTDYVRLYYCTALLVYYVLCTTHYVILTDDYLLLTTYYSLLNKPHAPRSLCTTPYLTGLKFLGRCESKLGNWRQAAVHWREAQQYEPGNENIQYDIDRADIEQPPLKV